MRRQEVQESYAEFVRVTTSAIEADRMAIEEKSAHLAEVEGGKADVEEAQSSADGSLVHLAQLFQASYLDCDGLLTHLQVRPAARQLGM